MLREKMCGGRSEVERTMHDVEEWSVAEMAGKRNGEGGVQRTTSDLQTVTDLMILAICLCMLSQLVITMWKKYWNEEYSLSSTTPFC